MTEHDKHCKHAGTLKGPAKIEYVREHGLTDEQVWRYGVTQAKKVTKKGRSKTKKTRGRVLIAQNWTCALCEVKDVNRWCLDKTGKVVCGRCSAYLAQWRRYRADRITDEDMEAFVSE